MAQFAPVALAKRLAARKMPDYLAGDTRHNSKTDPLLALIALSLGFLPLLAIMQNRKAWLAVYPTTFLMPLRNLNLLLFPKYRQTPPSLKISETVVPTPLTGLTRASLTLYSNHPLANLKYAANARQ